MSRPGVSPCQIPQHRHHRPPRHPIVNVCLPSSPPRTTSGSLLRRRYCHHACLPAARPPAPPLPARLSVVRGRCGLRIGGLDTDYRMNHRLVLLVCRRRIAWITSSHNVHMLERCGIGASRLCRLTSRLLHIRACSQISGLLRERVSLDKLSVALTCL